MARKHQVDVLFESDYNAIKRVHNFINFEECDALLDAVVTSESTGRTVVPLSARSESEVVDGIITKIESLATQMTGLAASLAKDPLLDAVQLPVEENREDCTVDSDGSSTCEGSINNASSEKVAIENNRIVLTLILVCKAPKKGGHIHFTKTGTSIVPKDVMGSAITILHEVDLEREQDPFVNEFVICPVTEGKLLIFSDNLAK